VFCRRIVIEGRLKKMGTTKIAIGLILGAGLGTAAGLILAPRSGKDTRILVKNKSTELVGTIKNRINERQKASVI
jgi:gas vesicle protein